MFRPFPPEPTRSSVSRLLGSLVLGATLLLSRATEADEPAKVPPGPVLNLSDGGYVGGSLEESTEAGVVRWKSPAFEKPLEFSTRNLQSIRFPGSDKLLRPSGAYGIELTGGDLLFGSILGLDDKEAELQTDRLGKIRVDRSRIRRIFPWKDGADLVYNGPNGLTGWKEIDQTKRAPLKNRLNVAIGFALGQGLNAPQPPPPPKPAVPEGPAWLDEGGQLFSNKDNATIQADVGLPAKASLEIELSWKKTPDFLLAIGVDDEASVARAFRFEVWEGQLVAVRVLEKSANLLPLLPIADGPGRVQLHLLIDQDQGKLLVQSADGSQLHELSPAGRPGPALKGIQLRNIRGDIRLERLRIGRWDGETPRPSDPKLSRIQLADLTTIRGQVERLDAATNEFIVKTESGETKVAADKIANIYLSQPDDKMDRTVSAVYRDGTRIGGDLVKVEGGTLVLESRGINGNLRLPLDGLQSIDFLGNEAKPLAWNEKPPEASEPTGTLELDGSRMKGRLVETGSNPGEAPLAWLPLAGKSSSPLVVGASGKIHYKVDPKPVASDPAAARRARAQAVQRAGVAQQNAVGMLFEAASNGNRGSGPRGKSIYLRTGDIIPAEIVKIDDQGVTFTSDLTPNAFVPHSRIKAVELSNELPNALKLSKAKFERLMTLPRMQRDSPPTHLIRSTNGDMLRGRIVAMDDKTIRVEVRLEEKEIPRDRVARIVWLHADETDPKKKPAEDPAAPESRFRVQAVRSDGIRLTFNAERSSNDTIFGKSVVLGNCKVKLAEVDDLLLGGFVEKEATQLAYQNWKLQNAPDPKSAQDDDGSSGGAAGTESSLVGKPAPDFELELLGGKKFHLADQKGKVIVLDFWATWCGPCLQAMPQIDKVTHEFADKGVELIAVNLQETPDKIKALLERQKLSPTVALDKDGVVAQRYAANAIPQTVVIDREGKITRLFIGGGPKLGDQLREALQALTPAQNP